MAKEKGEKDHNWPFLSVFIDINQKKTFPFACLKCPLVLLGAQQKIINRPHEVSCFNGITFIFITFNSSITHMFKVLIITTPKVDRKFAIEFLSSIFLRFRLNSLTEIDLKCAIHYNLYVGHIIESIIVILWVSSETCSHRI